MTIPAQYIARKTAPDLENTTKLYTNSSIAYNIQEKTLSLIFAAFQNYPLKDGKTSSSSSSPLTT